MVSCEGTRLRHGNCEYRGDIGFRAGSAADCLAGIKFRMAGNIPCNGGAWIHLADAMGDVLPRAAKASVARRGRIGAHRIGSFDACAIDSTKLESVAEEQAGAGDRAGAVSWRPGLVALSGVASALSVPRAGT